VYQAEGDVYIHRGSIPTTGSLADIYDRCAELLVGPAEKEGRS